MSIEQRLNHVQLMHLLSANSKLSCCTSCMSNTRPNTTTTFIIKPTKSRRSRLKKIASGQKCLTASSQNRGLPLISECWFCRAEPFCRLVKMLRAWVAPRIAGVIDCGGLLYWGHTIAKELPRHRISTAISRGSLACTLSSTEATQTRQGNFRIQPNLRDSGRPIQLLRVWKYTVSQKIH